MPPKKAMAHGEKLSKFADEQKPAEARRNAERKRLEEERQKEEKLAKQMEIQEAQRQEAQIEAQRTYQMEQEALAQKKIDRDERVLDDLVKKLQKKQDEAAAEADEKSSLDKRAAAEAERASQHKKAEEAAADRKAAREAADAKKAGKKAAREAADSKKVGKKAAREAADKEAAAEEAIIDVQKLVTNAHRALAVYKANKSDKFKTSARDDSTIAEEAAKRLIATIEEAATIYHTDTIIEQLAQAKQLHHTICAYIKDTLKDTLKEPARQEIKNAKTLVKDVGDTLEIAYIVKAVEL